MPNKTTTPIPCSWTRPIDGGPVEYYEVWHHVADQEWGMIGVTADTTYTVLVVVGAWNFVKVRAIGPTGETGVYSLDSDPYSPGVSGVPDEPGVVSIYVPIKKGC